MGKGGKKRTDTFKKVRLVSFDPITGSGYEWKYYLFEVTHENYTIRTYP